MRKARELLAQPSEVHGISTDLAAWRRAGPCSVMNTTRFEHDGRIQSMHIYRLRYHIR